MVSFFGYIDEYLYMYIFKLTKYPAIKTSELVPVKKNNSHIGSFQLKMHVYPTTKKGLNFGSNSCCSYKMYTVICLWTLIINTICMH